MTSTSETKIELVTEAIEALVLASVISATCTEARDRHANYDNVVAARATLKGCLKEFLAPSLRVISQSHRVDTIGGLSRSVTRTVAEGVPERVPYGGQGIDGMNLA